MSICQVQSRFGSRNLYDSAKCIFSGCQSVSTTVDLRLFLDMVLRAGNTEGLIVLCERAIHRTFLQSPMVLAIPACGIFDRVIFAIFTASDNGGAVNFKGIRT